MIRIDVIQPGRDFRLILTPNCSISWRQLTVFYLGTCSLTMVIGLLFYFQGQWMVLPFTGLEMMVLGVALYITSRKVYWREVITAIDDRVRIEKGIRRVEQYWEFERHWTGLNVETVDNARTSSKVELGSHGYYVEVGNFLSNFEKEELAFRLKDCIIRA